MTQGAPEHEAGPDVAHNPRFGRRIVQLLIAILLVFVLAVVALFTWANTLRQGERAPVLAVWRDPRVSATSTDHTVVLRPTRGAKGTGLVSIPGAKVDPHAYLFRLSGMVRERATVVITKPTANLAFFNHRPLDTFTADVPGVSRWFIGGHSLGGVRACALADSRTAPKVVGLVLFGGYRANDRSGSGLAVLSIAGERTA